MVNVISIEGYNLMPCSNPVARLLLKQKKAKVINKNPFTIKLLYKTTNYIQKEKEIKNMEYKDTVGRLNLIQTKNNNFINYEPYSIENKKCEYGQYSYRMSLYDNDINCKDIPIGDIFILRTQDCNNILNFSKKRIIKYDFQILSNGISIFNIEVPQMRFSNELMQFLPLKNNNVVFAQSIKQGLTQAYNIYEVIDINYHSLQNTSAIVIQCKFQYIIPYVCIYNVNGFNISSHYAEQLHTVSVIDNTSFFNKSILLINNYPVVEDETWIIHLMCEHLKKCLKDFSQKAQYIDILKLKDWMKHISSYWYRFSEKYGERMAIDTIVNIFNTLDNFCDFNKKNKCVPYILMTNFFLTHEFAVYSYNTKKIYMDDYQKDWVLELYINDKLFAKFQKDIGELFVEKFEEAIKNNILRFDTSIVYECCLDELKEKYHEKNTEKQQEETL